MSAKWTRFVVVIRKEVAPSATAHLDTVERNAPVSSEVHTAYIVWCCQLSATYMHVGAVQNRAHKRWQFLPAKCAPTLKERSTSSQDGF